MFLLGAPALAQDGADGQGGFTVIAKGLDNPRGIAIGEDGAIYVAKADTETCVESPGPEGGKECFGRTGAVTRIMDGSRERIADGFLSRAGPAGAPLRRPCRFPVRRHPPVVNSSGFSYCVC